MPPLNIIVRAATLPPWWLAAGVTLAVALTAFVVVQRLDMRGRGTWPDVAVGWWLWHWFTGAPLEPRAGFHKLTAPWVARRVAVGLARTAAAGLLVVTEYVRSGSPWGTAPLDLAAVDLAGAALAGLGVWVLFFVALEVKHYRVWVQPLHRSIHRVTGHAEATWPWSYLRVPRDRAHGRDGVIVHVAPSFDVKAKNVAGLIEAVTTRLDLGDAVPTPVLHRRHGYVRFQPREYIPSIARYSQPEIRALLDKARRSAPIMGVTTGGRPVAIDLDTESPHILISAGTGGGKTALARTLLAQLMRDGADVTVIDVKRRSHQWLRRFDGVTYARDIGDIHKALLEVAFLGHRRRTPWDDIDIDEPGPPRPNRHILLCEEMNSTISHLRDWWKDKDNPYAEPGPRGVCPSIRALSQILFMGREAGVHVISIAQMATANDMGSSAARAQHNTIVMARYPQSAAKMLVPECDLPPSTRHPGRVQVCIGGEHWETQAIYMTPQEARDYVAEVRDLQPKGLPAARVASRGIPSTQGERTVTVADVADTMVTLQQFVGGSRRDYDRLRQAIHRAPSGERPAVVGKDGNADLYLLVALQRFLANRPRALQPQPEAVDNGRSEVDGVDRMDNEQRA